MQEVTITLFCKNIWEDTLKLSAIPIWYQRSTSYGITSSSHKKLKFCRGGNIGRYQYISSEQLSTLWTIDTDSPRKVPHNYSIHSTMILLLIVRPSKWLLTNTTTQIRKPFLVEWLPIKLEDFYTNLTKKWNLSIKGMLVLSTILLLNLEQPLYLGISLNFTT